MKIMVISDTHRDIHRLAEVLKKERPDLLLHCGDICGDEGEVSLMSGCPFYVVAGNMDYGSELKNAQLIDVGEHRIFMVHGHRHEVRYGTELLAQTALSAGADIALYGHTHIPDITEGERLLIMNPGSFSYPRQSDRRCCYGTIRLEEDGSVIPKLHYI